MRGRRRRRHGGGTVNRATGGSVVLGVGVNDDNVSWLHESPGGAMEYVRAREQRLSGGVAVSDFMCFLIL